MVPYKCHRRFHFFISNDRSRVSRMIPAVVLAVVLVAPAFSLPLTTEEFPVTGVQGEQITQTNTGYVNPQVTTGEKTGIQEITQTITGTHEGSFTETTGTRTGVQELPTGVQNVQQTQSQVLSQVEQAVQPVVQVYSGTPGQYPVQETVPQVEKTGVQVPAEGYTSQQYPENYSQNTPVTKIENTPVNVENVQQTPSPVLLPIQPLTVVPVNQVGGLLRPVIVPEEAITSGRVIIMAIEPITQRTFQEVPVVPQKQVPYQQEPQQVGQTYVPVQVQPNQVPYVRDQVVPNPEIQQVVVDPVQTYTPVQQTPQVYDVQPNPVVNEYVEKQVPQQSGYTPEHGQYVQPEQVQSHVQQTVEKQGEVQQVSSYTPVQNPVPLAGSHPYQQVVEQQQQVYNQQPSERQTPYQQTNEYVPVQPVEQQVYNVNPEYQQGYVPVQTQNVQQQVYNVPHEQQQGYTPGQPHPVDRQATEQVPYQQPIQPVQYVHPHQEEYQQVTNVQPFVGSQVETHVPLQQENTAYVPQQVQKTSEVVGTQPEQVVNYASEPVYNFGDRIPQQQTVQQSHHVAQNPIQLVNPSVVSTQA